MRKISLNKKDKSINPTAKLVLIILAVFMVCIGIAVFVFLRNYHIFETKVVKPTCEADGYREAVCVICKKIDRTHYTPKLGHNFGKVTLRTKPKEIEFGKNFQRCLRLPLSVA